MFLPRVIGIDCGAAHVACSWWHCDQAGRLQLRQMAVESFAAHPADPELWLRAVTAALRAIKGRVKMPGRDCVLAVPGSLVWTKFVRTPAVDRGHRSRVVHFEAGQNIPLPLDEVAWGQIEVADDGSDLDLMLAAVKLGAMEALVAAVEAAGFKVVLAEPAGLALRRALACNYPGEAAPTLVVDVGARATHLVFAAGEKFYLRTLPLAGDTVTQGMAEELQVDFAIAEKLKRQWLKVATDSNPDPVAQVAGSRAAEAFNQRLVQEITRARLGYGRQPGAVLPERILLAGGGSRLPGLAEALSEKLGLPIFCYEATQQLNLDARLAGGDVDADRLPILVGLAAAWFQADGAQLDLLPPARREHRERQSRSLWRSAAAGLVLAALVPPIFFYRGQSVRLEARTTQIAQELAPLRRLESANAAKLQRLQVVQQKIASIEKLAAGRTDWLAWMADLQSSLAAVGDVWLDRMNLVPPVPANRPGAEIPPVRLELRGRLLDQENPLAKASADSFARAKALFGRLAQSPFVAAVEGERFDSRQPGILQFEVTLVLNSQRDL